MPGFSLFRSHIVGQMLRYGLVGVLLAGLYALVYWGLITQAGVWPQAANAAAFTVNLFAGWILHSGWSFRGYGSPAGRRAAQAGFVVINLLGYGLNSLWVWLVVAMLHRPAGQALIPIVVVTPMVNFVLNRVLVFRFRL